MSARKLLTNGNAFKRTDNRWGGVVWYMDESGERKRKSFSGTTKAEVNKKMTEYIAAFNDSIIESQETKKRLKDSMQNWLAFVLSKCKKPTVTTAELLLHPRQKFFRPY